MIEKVVQQPLGSCVDGGEGIGAEGGDANVVGDAVGSVLDVSSALGGVAALSDCSLCASACAACTLTLTGTLS